MGARPRREVIGPWVIVVDAMDCRTAERIAGYMLKEGASGMFLTGTIASKMQELKRYRKELMGK